MPRSMMFGRLWASGIVAAPISMERTATSAPLARRRPRIWPEIHSSTSVLTPTAWVGAQLEIGVFGDSAIARGGTGRPEAAVA